MISSFCCHHIMTTSRIHYRMLILQYDIFIESRTLVVQIQGFKTVYLMTNVNVHGQCSRKYRLHSTKLKIFYNAFTILFSLISQNRQDHFYISSCIHGTVGIYQFKHKLSFYIDGWGMLCIIQQNRRMVRPYRVKWLRWNISLLIRF